VGDRRPLERRSFVSVQSEDPPLPSLMPWSPALANVLLPSHASEATTRVRQHDVGGEQGPVFAAHPFKRPESQSRRVPRAEHEQ